MDQQDPRMDRRDEARLERLSAYLDGWVTDQERAAVDHELAADAAAREALDDLRLVRTALAHLDTPRAPRSFALAAAPERRPLGLFRRMEWATRGAAGLVALAFTFALVNGPQASETVTSAVPVAAQERSLAADSAAAPAAAPAGTAPKARETATQTLDVTPGAAASGPATQGAAASATPTTTAGAAASTPAAASPRSLPAPADATPSGVPAATPAAASTPAPSAAPAPAPASAPPAAGPTPQVLLAPPATATPADGATAGTTPVPAVEPTRLATAVPPTPSATPAAAVVAPAPAGPEAKAADSTVLAPVPVTGTLPPDSASEDAGEMGVTPALGVLAMLLALLAIIQRAGTRPTRG